MADVTLHDVKWEERGSVLAFIDNLLRLKDDENIHIERQAELNTAWYQGYQQVFWDKDSRQLTQQDNPNGRVRLTYNVMKGQINDWIAKIQTAPIHFQAEAATDDLLDFEQARLRTKVLQHYERELGIRRMGLRADTAAALHGEIFIKVCWDPQAGQELGAIRSEELELDEQTYRKRYGSQAENLKMGDLAVILVPVFNLFWGPTSCVFEEAEWVLELHERSAAAVAERYDRKFEELLSVPEEETRITRPGQTTVWGAQVYNRERGVVVVKELWVRPNRKLAGLERGRHIVAAGQTVLINGPNPYRHRRIPIVRYPMYDTEGSNRATTFVTDLMPVQADLNRAISQYSENRELLANPTWLVPEASVVDTNEWDNRPGGVRQYRGSTPPRIEPGQLMPAGIWLMIQFAKQTMQDVIGLHDASQGKNPPGVRSARAIMQLTEKDEERMGIVGVTRNDVWQDVAWLILETLSQFGREERTMRILGEEQQFQNQVFSPEKLGRLSKYDIRVTTTGRPQSRSAKLDNVDRAMERGFLRPDRREDRDYVFQLLEIGDASRGMDPSARAREVQHERNLRMARGEYTAPQHYEDLDAFKLILDEFRGRAFFARLPQAIRDLFQRYADELLMQAFIKSVRPHLAAQQGAQQMGIQPAAPAAPTGSPPGASAVAMTR